MNRFEEWFWLGNDTTVAINSLNGKVSQGHAEVQEIVTFFQEFVNVHEHYATTIRGMQNKTLAQLFPLGNASQGFERDDGGSLKRAFFLVRDESLRLAEEHAVLASLIKQNIINPLKLWVDEGKKMFKTRKTEFETLQRNFDRTRQEVAKKKQFYENACRAFDAVKVDTASAESRQASGSEQAQLEAGSSDQNVTQLDIVTNVGPLSLSAKELSTFLSTVQNTLKHRDIKYPLLGVFRVFTGEDFVVHLQQQGHLFNMSTGFTPEAAIKIGQDLMDLGYIRLVGVGQKKFVAKDNWQYQWKKTAEVLLQEKAVEAKREADAADEAYKASVTAAEKVYQEYERSITELLHFIQTVEMARITTVKKALVTFTGSLQTLGQNVTKCAQTIVVALESVQADKDIEVLCEQYKTGIIRPQQLIYENYYKDAASECLFTIPLRDHCQYTRTRVPWIVGETLKAIDFQTKDEPYESVLVTWLNAMDVDVTFLHAIRTALNRVEPIQAETLSQQFSAPMLIAVLRRYLMELPYPLIFEEYEKIKTLYISKTHENDVFDRLHSVREIICMLPRSHFHTLNYFLKYLNRFFIQPLHTTEIEEAGGAPLSAVEFLGSNKFADSNIPYQFNLIASFWGPVIIRSNSLGSLGLNNSAEDEDAIYMNYDHHPERVLKDMILNYDELFLGGHLKPAGSSRDKSPEKNSQVPSFPRRPSISSTVSEDEANDQHLDLPENKRKMETIVLASVTGGVKEKRRLSIVSQENNKDFSEVSLDMQVPPTLNQRSVSLNPDSNDAHESPVSLLHSYAGGSPATSRIIAQSPSPSASKLFAQSPPRMEAIVSPEPTEYKTLNVSQGSPESFRLTSPIGTQLETADSPIEDIVDNISPIMSPENSPEPVAFEKTLLNDSPQSLILSPDRQAAVEQAFSPKTDYADALSPQKSPIPVAMMKQASHGSPVSVNLGPQEIVDLEKLASPQDQQAETLSPVKSSPFTNNLEADSSPDMLMKSVLSPASPGRSPEPSPRPFQLNQKPHDPLDAFEAGVSNMDSLMSPETALSRIISPVRAFDSMSPSKSPQDPHSNPLSFKASPVFYEEITTDDEEEDDNEEVRGSDFFNNTRRLSSKAEPPIAPPPEPPALSPDPIQAILSQLPKQLNLNDNETTEKKVRDSIAFQEVTEFAYETDEDMDNDSQPVSPEFIKQYGIAKIPPLSETVPPSMQPREGQTLKRAVHPDSDDDVDALD